MADVYSDVITARDAEGSSTYTAPNSAKVGGFLRETVAVVTPAADEATTSDLVLCAVPSNARISQISLRHAEAATTGQGNVGVMRKVDGAYTYTGGDADLFASAYDFDDGGSATNVWVDVEIEAAITHALSVLPLWEAMGLSEDPGEDFYVSIDVSEIFAGGPTSIAARVRFVV